MKWNKISLLTLLFLSLGHWTWAQQDQGSRVKAELSGTFLDYNLLNNGTFNGVRSLDPGITIGGHVSASRWLDASLYSTFAPDVDYPLDQEESINTSLIDVRALARLKSNGTIFREDALIAPYIATGFGFNTASNNLRVYIPAALGVRFQLSENVALQVEGMYKQPLQAAEIQHLAYSAGFVFGFPGRREVAPLDTNDLEPVDPGLLADRDRDGVPDIDDSCPDEKGKALDFGCPEDTYADVPTDPSLDKDPVTDLKPAAPVIISEPDPIVSSSPSTSTYGSSSQATDNYQPMPTHKLNFLRESGQRIYFAEGSAELTAESMRVLDEVANILEDYPSYHLEVMGYTGDGGSVDANKILSVQRGFAVKKYLVYTRGIKYARIYSDGRGANQYGQSGDPNRVDMNPIAPGSRAYRGE